MATEIGAAMAILTNLDEDTHMRKAAASLALVSALAVTGVHAADEDDHAAHRHPGADASQAAPGDDKGGHAKADEMHRAMKKMHEQMEKIHATTDPQERRKLMDEHMQSMREGMKMMRGMGGKKKGESMMEDGAAGMDKDKGMGMDREKGAEKDGKPMMGMMMMKRHKMMEDRLDGMQKMMEQMLEHEAAEQEMEHTR